MIDNKKCMLLLAALLFLILVSGCASVLYGTLGTVKIETNPIGAKVLIDGKDTGKLTPCTLGNVPIGDHVVELIYGEMKYAETIEISMYRIAEINVDFDYKAELIKIKALPSIMHITLSQGNTVGINSVTAYYRSGTSKSIPISNCNYSSSNTAYAIVNKNGAITGISAGAAVITASYTEGIKTVTNDILVYIRNTPEDNPIILAPIVPTPPVPTPEPEPEQKPEPDYTADVSYIIWGTASTVDVTLINSDGGIEQYTDVPLPFFRKYDIFDHYFLYISAQNGESSGTVNAECYYKGKLKNSAHSEGSYVIATASYSIIDE